MFYSESLSESDFNFAINSSVNKRFAILIIHILPTLKDLSKVFALYEK